MTAEASDVPETVGRYEIVRPLAEGGMGQLFLARATAVGGFAKNVVLKRLRPSLAGDPTYVQMLLDEARILATLDHPNVVQVVDVVLHQGAVYLAMEYIVGWDLKQVLATGGERALPPGAAVAIAMAMCAALDYAHARTGDDGEPLAIVHRDVSPGNVIVGADGGVKVIDFGIARSVLKEHATETGMVRGKLVYMSPEQCRGGRVDGRSDVFSIGVTLYEMLTGALPHAGADDYELRKAIVERPPAPLGARVDAIGPALEAVVLAALEKDQARRPPTPSALARELHAAARASGLDLSPFALAQHLRHRFGGPELASPASIRAPSGATVPVATSATVSTMLPRGGSSRTVGAVVGALLVAFGVGYVARSLTTPPAAPTSPLPVAGTPTSPAERDPLGGRSPPDGDASAAASASAPTASASSLAPTAPTPRAAPLRPGGARTSARTASPDPDAPLPR